AFAVRFTDESSTTGRIACARRNFASAVRRVALKSGLAIRIRCTWHVSAQTVLANIAFRTIVARHTRTRLVVERAYTVGIVLVQCSSTTASNIRGVHGCFKNGGVSEAEHVADLV